VGSGTHFAGEMFKAMAAIDVVHVPFKGIPEALTETLTGRVQFFMAPIANAVGQVKEGKLTGLGVSSAEARPLAARSAHRRRGGVPGYESILWFGLLISSAVSKTDRDETPTRNRAHPLRARSETALDADRPAAAADHA